MSQTCYGQGDAFKVPSIYSNHPEKTNVYGLPEAAEKGKRFMKSFYGKNQLAPGAPGAKDFRSTSL